MYCVRRVWEERRINLDLMNEQWHRHNRIHYRELSFIFLTCGLNRREQTFFSWLYVHNKDSQEKIREGQHQCCFSHGINSIHK